jgi:vancomycin resistance protein YoaR
MLKTKILYKGNYQKLYEKLMEKEEFPLEKINKELSLDVKNLPKKYDKVEKDAQVKYLGNGKFEYKKEEIGYKINIDKIMKSIFISLNSDGYVELSKEYIQPIITEKHLRATTQKIAEFSTSCTKSSAERKHNIGLACEKINSVQVLPNAEFSFNKVVGARTKERGFKTAKIIVSGEFVEGTGGGVCQVSTTLYNAWCLAGLKVTRSATHSLPVHYVSPGLDAMVASTSDLVLLNDTDSTIYIDSHLTGSTIKFTLYGEPSGFIVKLRSEVLEILSGKQYVEEKIEITDWKEEELFRILKNPKDGLVSASYREFYDHDGTLLFKERLRKTIYLAQKGKIVYKFSTNSQAS